MLIALLDDGLDPCFVPKEKIACDLCVGEDGSIRERSGEDVFLTHHGSIVANIILQYAPDTVFCSLRIFYDDALSATRTQLEAGLNWCLRNRIPVVHLSAGTKNLADYGSLRPIVARMVLQGQILVAAHSNSEGYCMPACFSGVFCVRADASMNGFSYAPDMQENGMAFRASSRHGKICGEDTVLANSYAAPTVTAALCLNYEEYSSARNRGQVLYRKLTGKEPRYRTPDFAENALVVNRSGTELAKEAFFFGRHESPAQAASAGAEGQDSLGCGAEDSLKKVLVWIPEKQGDPQEEEWLIQAAKRENIAGILYCGSLSRKSDMKLRDYLVWTENDVQEIGVSETGAPTAVEPEIEKPKIRKQEPCMVPLVMIVGERGRAVRFAIALQKCFLREKYACVCASDIPMCYLYGMHAVSSGVFGKRELSVVQRNLQPDLILCCSEHWMEGIGRRHYFVITLKGACGMQGVKADMDVLSTEPEAMVEEVKEAVISFTWPDENEV